MIVAQPEGNYFNKYQNNGKIINLIMKRFFSDFDSLLNNIEYEIIYEAGCGEGYISQHVYNLNLHKGKTVDIFASDLSEKVINQAKIEFPYIHFNANSIYDLGEENNSFDLVIASEVLEHLEKPEKALEEIFRISRNYVLISVPNEPIWCIANFVRGKYIKSFGNTPGHIKHWSKNGIIKLAKEFGDVLEVKNPFPWTIILCKKRLLA